MENREIKLKVWDAENKVFFDTGDTDVYWNCMEGVLTAHHSSENGDWRQLEIIQFTGLSDKNGVEIYKSDIVKSFKEPYEDEVSINTVEFIRGCWTLVCKGKNDIPLFNYEPEHLEVIGNVYQNSDLLK